MPFDARELRRLIAPVEHALAQNEEVLRRAQQISESPALKSAIREMERYDLPAQQFQEIAEMAKRVKAEIRTPVVPPETIQAMQRSVRPISDDLIRGLQQQTRFQEQLREIAERLERLNIYSEAAAEDEGIPDPPPPPEDPDDLAGWRTRLPPPILTVLLWLAIGAHNDIEALIAEAGAGNVPAVLLHAAKVVAALIAAILDAISRKRKDS